MRTETGDRIVATEARFAMARTRLAHHPAWWRVRDVMTTDVACVAPSATYDEIVDVLLARRVSGLPVTGDDRRLLGVVTESDLLPREAATALATGAVPEPHIGATGGVDRVSAVPRPAATAGALMTSDVLTAGPDDDLPSTAARLLASGHRRLPVVTDDGRLVGVVSPRDLLAPAWDYPAAPG